jgi:hypothetical protein
MLKTVEISRALKTKGIAVTYRSGSTNMFNTCPTSCALNDSGHGTNEIDTEYLKVLSDARPRRGFSFTYSHFKPVYYSHLNVPNKTVVNYSADNLTHAEAYFRGGHPVVTVVAPDFWNNRQKKEYVPKKSPILKEPFLQKIIRCPAEYLDNFSCRDCGNGRPLCARLDRNYIIGFTAHGYKKNLAAAPSKSGGCYAGGGNVAIHWRNMVKQQQKKTDAESLRDFMRILPPLSIIRHHVAGDLGKEPS